MDECGDGIVVVGRRLWNEDAGREQGGVGKWKWKQQRASGEGRNMVKREKKEWQAGKEGRTERTANRGMDRQDAASKTASQPASQASSASDRRQPALPFLTRHPANQAHHHLPSRVRERSVVMACGSRAGKGLEEEGGDR